MLTLLSFSKRLRSALLSLWRLPVRSWWSSRRRLTPPAWSPLPFKLLFSLGNIPSRDRCIWSTPLELITFQPLCFISSSLFTQCLEWHGMSLFLGITFLIRVTGVGGSCLAPWRFQMFVLFCIDSHSVFPFPIASPPPNIFIPHLPAISWSVSCFSFYVTFFHGQFVVGSVGLVAGGRCMTLKCRGYGFLHYRRTNVKQSLSNYQISMNEL